MARPHEVVGGLADGVVNGVRGVGNGLVGAVKGAGENIMSALDKPFESVSGGRQGPHRIADRLAKGAIDAGVNAVDVGLVGSVQKAGAGIMSALAQPVEATGFPPDINTGKLFKGR